MENLYHQILPFDFTKRLQSLIGYRLLNITGKQLLVSMTQSGGTKGLLYDEKVRVCFESINNHYITIFLYSENYETFIGEDVEYFSKCTIHDECISKPDISNSFELYYDFIIESIEIFGKKRDGIYQYIENNITKSVNFDILTESLILFKDKRGNYFCISSNGNDSVRFEFSGKIRPSELFQKYIDSEEYILKKHFTIEC